MMSNDDVYRPDYDLGAFRYAAARYVKLLIRARWKVEPGFLSAETLTAWGLPDIASDRYPAWRLLHDAALALGHLNSHFLPRCGSGGVRMTDESTPEGRLIDNLVGLAQTGDGGGPEHNGALLEAARRLREDKDIDWGWLVAWETLGAIRADLDQLPHPQPAPRLTLDQEAHTITLDGRSYPGIDPVAFQIFEEIWNARPQKVSSTKLLTLQGLHGKNIPRELKKLPADLRALVQGAGGAGYWIDLSSQSCL